MDEPNFLKRLHVRTGFSCNNDCVFCIDGGKKPTVQSTQWLRIRDEAADVLRANRGLPVASFTTGEPTLNPFLADLVKLAKSLGYHTVSVITNGRRLAEMSHCRELAVAGADHFIVSIHAHNAELGDAISRKEGSFNESLRGLRNLLSLRREFPFMVSTATVLNKMNYLHIGEILRLLLDEGAPNIVVNPAEIKGRAKENLEIVAERYSIMTACFKDALGTLSESERSRIKTEAIPFCLMRGAEQRVGRYNEINIIRKSGEGMRRLSASAMKGKRAACGKCVYLAACDGVWSSYRRVFGWKEFRPVAVIHE